MILQEFLEQTHVLFKKYELWSNRVTQRPYSRQLTAKSAPFKAHQATEASRQTVPLTAAGYYLTSYGLFTLLQGFTYCVNATRADEIPPELTEAKVTAPQPPPLLPGCGFPTLTSAAGHIPAKTQEDQGDRGGEHTWQQQLLEKSKKLFARAT